MASTSMSTLVATRANNEYLLLVDCARKEARNVELSAKYPDNVLVFCLYAALCSQMLVRMATMCHLRDRPDADFSINFSEG